MTDHITARVAELEKAVSPRPSYCPGAVAPHLCELIVVPCQCAVLRARLAKLEGTP